MGLALIVYGASLPVAIGAALLVGLVAGTLNGALVAWAGLPPFIVTLGTYGMAQSLAMVLTEGNSVTGLPTAVRWFNEGERLGLPVPIWAVIAAFVVTYALLYHTKAAATCSRSAATVARFELSGVRVRAYVIAVYAYADLLARACLLHHVRADECRASHHRDRPGVRRHRLAVVLGGRRSRGGHGGIWGTVIGAAAVAVLRNGLNLIGLSTEWQVAVVGLVIVAVALDGLRDRA